MHAVSKVMTAVKVAPSITLQKARSKKTAYFQRARRYLLQVPQAMQFRIVPNKRNVHVICLNLIKKNSSVRHKVNALLFMLWKHKCSSDSKVLLTSLNLQLSRMPSRLKLRIRCSEHLKALNIHSYHKRHLIKI